MVARKMECVADIAECLTEADKHAAVQVQLEKEAAEHINMFRSGGFAQAVLI